jgi:hypothetical protein
VCARRLGEWQFLANDGAQGAVFKARKEPGVDIASSTGVMPQSVNARIEARLPISSRGLMVTSPRLPMTMTRGLSRRRWVRFESAAFRGAGPFSRVGPPGRARRGAGRRAAPMFA